MLAGDLDWEALARGVETVRAAREGGQARQEEDQGQEAPAAQFFELLEAALPEVPPARGSEPPAVASAEVSSTPAPACRPRAELDAADLGLKPEAAAGVSAAAEAAEAAARAEAMARRVSARDALAIAHELRREVVGQRAQLSALRAEHERVRQNFADYRDHASAMVAALQRHLGALMVAAGVKDAQPPAMPAVLESLSDQLRAETERRDQLLADSESEAEADEGEGEDEDEAAAAVASRIAAGFLALGAKETFPAAEMAFPMPPTHCEADGLIAEENGLPHFSAARRQYHVAGEEVPRARAPPPFLLGGDASGMHAARPTPGSTPEAYDYEGDTAGSCSPLNQKAVALQR